MSPTDPTKPQVLMLPSSQPPFAPPSLFDLAAFVDAQAESLKKLCAQLSATFDACSQDLDPRLDEQEMFDLIGARFLWNHVPDLRDIASRASILGFWLAILQGAVEVHRDQTDGR